MEGALGRAPLLGNPKDDLLRDMCMPCKRVSLSIGALLGSLEGVRLLGLLREMNSVSGYHSWTLRSFRF